jgi:hypothetical protein
MEAVEPVHMQKETGSYQSRFDRMKEKIKAERQLWRSPEKPLALRTRNTFVPA